MADSKPNSNRRVEGEEGAGAHQEGPHSVQAGQTQRREQSPPEKGRSTRQGNKRSTDGSPNGQKV
jgi:hypothetical protein